MLTRSIRTLTRARRGLAVMICLTLVFSVALPSVASANLFAVWEVLDPGVGINFQSVFFVDAQTGWAVGSAGGGATDDPSILKTSDGGDTWVVQYSRVTHDFRDVFFIDENTGWAVGSAEGTTERRNVWKTVDGGDTWVHHDVDTISGINAVHFVDENVGYCVTHSSRIFKTTDGGETWVAQAPGTGGISEHFEDVHFVDEDTGWVVGGFEVILSTVDGGETWLLWEIGIETDYTLFPTGVHFVDRDTGWVVAAGAGDPKIIKTTDGGATWVEQHAGLDVGLQDVHFVDENRGWAVGNSGLILSTADGGETWVEERRVQGEGSLHSVHFVDAEHGWAVGPDGLALRYTTGLPPVLDVEGDDRFGTAVEVSQIAFPDGAETVVIATGRNWPDALGGTALAGVLDAPILLVSRDSIPAATVTEIGRLGAAKAVILGGEAAVGAGVEAALSQALGEANVTRIGGANRYETADLVAARVKELRGAAYDGTAFVATGANFPDALAAGPLAAANGWPLHLVHPARGISEDTWAAMEGATEVLILGGEGAVSVATAVELVAEYGADKVIRLAGTTRYDTAVAVATHGVEHAGLAWDRVGIATGQRFPDALAGGVLQGGVLQGKVGSVMLLTRSTSLELATRQALADNKEAIETVTFFGGGDAISAEVRAAVAQALE